MATNLTVDAGASISARSYNAAGTFDAAGSGGSIWIKSGTLSGTGAILADGGNSSGRSGGGGGRIAIYLTASDDFGAVTNSARGGDQRSDRTRDYGAAGTIYRQGMSATYGDLLVSQLFSNVPL